MFLLVKGHTNIFFVFTEGKVYTESRTVNDWLVGGGPSPRRAYLDDHGDRYNWMGASSNQVDDPYGRGSQFLRVGTSNLDQPSRTPSPLPSHRRQRLSASTAPWPNVGRRLGHGVGGGRRLPPTPNKPSTLNIDSLTNVAAVPSNSGLQPSKEGNENHSSNRLSINFPKLNLSPSRSSLLTNLKNRTLGTVVGNTGQSTGGGGSGARLPDLPEQATKGGNHRRQLPRRGGRWSRSLDDPATFEEVVRAGRGLFYNYRYCCECNMFKSVKIAMHLRK